MRFRNFPVLFFVFFALANKGSAQSIPHVFSPGSVIKAEELNANFRAVASAASGVRVLVNNTAIGTSLGLSWDGMYVITPKGYIFFFSGVNSSLYESNTSSNDGTSFSFGAELDDYYLNGGLYYEQPNCQGKAYVRASFFRGGSGLRFSNGYVFSDGKKLLMKRADNTPVTLPSIPQSVLTGDPNSGYSCYIVRTTLPNGAPLPGAVTLTTKFYPISENEPSITGVPATIPASGSVGKVSLGSLN